MKLIHYLFMVVVLSLPTAGLAQQPTPQDFAWGVQIDTTHSSPVQMVALTDSVYLNLVYSDLKDLRVFNADGNQVPHAFNYPTREVSTTTQQYSIAYFPVYGIKDQSLDRIQVQVERGRTGALIKVQDGETHFTRTLRAYILDLSQLDEAVNQIKVDWKEAPENLLVPITVEYSDNLINWRRWGSSQSLSHLQHNQQLLEKKTLDVPAKLVKYARISWPANIDMPEISQFQVQSSSHTTQRRRLSTSFVMEATEEAGQYAIATGAIIPESVQITLPASQTLARIKLESASTPRGPWAVRYQGLVYNLEANNTPLQSGPILVPAFEHTHWRVSQVDEVAWDSAPSLEVNWRPANVLFIAQGPAPYTLAFGNTDAEAATFSATELFTPVANQFNAISDLPAANLGPIYKLGGTEKSRPQSSWPWEKVVLWISLCAGVIVLGSIALRLLKDKPAEGKAE